MNTEVNAMDLNYLFKDRPAGDPLGKTEDPAVLVMGGRGKLHMMLNGIADGEKHPVMLLLHGFPGNEKNLDLAQAFRRIGFNVFTFNYSGAWGSAGPFSFANGIEDVRTVIEYIRSCDTVGSCRLDNDNLFLCGHSMGGFFTLRTLAEIDGIKAACVMAPYDFALQSKLSATKEDARQNLDDLLAEGAPWLEGADAAALRKELLDHEEDFVFSNGTDKIAGTPMLVLGAAFDECAVTKYQARHIYDTIAALGKGKTYYEEIESDHSFSNRRCQQAETVAKWFISNID